MVNLIDIKKIYENIENLKNEHYFTKEQFCEKFNISDRKYNLLKNGERLFSVDDFINIANYFDVTLDYLFGTNIEKK